MCEAEIDRIGRRLVQIYTCPIILFGDFRAHLSMIDRPTPSVKRGHKAYHCQLPDMVGLVGHSALQLQNVHSFQTHQEHL